MKISINAACSGLFYEYGFLTLCDGSMSQLLFALNWYFFVNVTFFYLNENCIWVKHLVSFKFLLLYSLNFRSNGNALEKKRYTFVNTIGI